MAKQEKLDFDYEEYFNSLLETTAVLMWATHIPSFTFAFYLNQLYNLSLVRNDIVTIKRKSGSVDCVIYTYLDNVMQTAYFLVDNIEDSATAQRGGMIFDKALLVYGPDSHKTAQQIFNDLEASPLPPTGIESRHDLTRRAFIESGIIESAMFDFSDPDEPDTTYFPHSSTNESLNKKRAVFLKKHREYIADLFMAIDHLLPDFEEMDD